MSLSKKPLRIRRKGGGGYKTNAEFLIKQFPGLLIKHKYKDKEILSILSLNP